MENSCGIVPSTKLLTLEVMHYLFFSLLMIGFIAIVTFSDNVYAQSLVDIVMHPDVKILRLDDPNKPSMIAFIAETEVPNPSFTWILNGPGKLQGEQKGKGIFYIPPEEITVQSIQVSITVAIVNEEKDVFLEKREITLLQPNGLPSSPTPSPTHMPLASPDKGPIGIQKIQLRGNENYIKPPTYYLEPDEAVTITPEIIFPPGRAIIFKCNAVFGTISFKKGMDDNSQLKANHEIPKKSGESVLDDSDVDNTYKILKDSDNKHEIEIELTEKKKVPQIVYLPSTDPNKRADFINLTLIYKDTKEEICKETINVAIRNTSQ